MIIDALRLTLAVWFFIIAIRSYETAAKHLPIRLAGLPKRISVPVAFSILTEPTACVIVSIILSTGIGQ